MRRSTVSLTEVYDTFAKALPDGPDESRGLAMANSRARLRMTTLYALAQRAKSLVAGTGNKVEDFGVGFYTKYGDGGVDLSPIADLNKTEVFALAAHLGVIDEIQQAAPTDGLWGTTAPTKTSWAPPTPSWNGPWGGNPKDIQTRRKPGCPGGSKKSWPPTAFPPCQQAQDGAHSCLRGAGRRPVQGLTPSSVTTSSVSHSGRMRASRSSTFSVTWYGPAGMWLSPSNSEMDTCCMPRTKRTSPRS